MSEFGNSTEPSTKSTTSAVPSLRLNIQHLMLWTLCCSVYWWLSRAVNAMSTTHFESGLFSGIVTGAVFTGVITLVSMRLRGGPRLLNHPGHWLLVISAINTLINMLVIHSIAGSIAVMNPFDINSWEFVVLRVVQLFPPIAFAFAAARIRDRGWKIVFGAMVLKDAPALLYFLGMELPGSYFRPWPSLVLASAMVVISSVEIKIGPRRDWLHWTGVMTYFAIWTNQVLWVSSAV